MTGKRSYYQMSLDFDPRREGEALSVEERRTESVVAERKPESPTDTEQLMEEVCQSENLQRALTQVKANKGNPGVDGMSVERLPGYLRKHWSGLREQLLTGTYKPRPVKRVAMSPVCPLCG